MYNKELERDRRNLIRIVEKYHVRNHTNWVPAVDELNNFFKEERTKEGWRGQYRMLTNPKFQEQREKAIVRRDDKRVQKFELRDRLLKHLKKERSMSWLLYKLEVDKTQILATVQELQIKGYNISAFERDEEMWFKAERKVPNHQNIYDHKVEGGSIKIALISDTHLGSNYQQLQSLHHFYEYAYNQGVRAFYNAGDITDGYYPHRHGNAYEIHKHGFQQQLDYAAEVYPYYEDAKTYFITGRNWLASAMVA